MTPNSFKLVDVAPETIMSVALNAANRHFATSANTTIADLQKATQLSKQVAANAAGMAVQLRMLDEVAPGEFTFVGNSNLRISPKSGLSHFFREAAQQFPPYLMYLSFRSRGYEELESANQAASIFGLGLDSKRMVALFGRWGRYAGIEDKSGAMDFVPKEVLDIGFLSRLSAALTDAISTKTFVINELGSGIAGEIYSRGLDLDAISRALAVHENNPKEAMREAGNLLESYLADLATPLGGPKSQLGHLIDWLQGNAKAMLKTHRNVAIGATGLRNAGDHGADPDTGKTWTLSSEAALVGTLLVMLSLKSIERFRRDQSQEILSAKQHLLQDAEAIASASLCASMPRRARRGEGRCSGTGRRR